MTNNFSNKQQFQSNAMISRTTSKMATPPPAHSSYEVRMHQMQSLVNNSGASRHHQSAFGSKNVSSQRDSKPLHLAPTFFCEPCDKEFNQEKQYQAHCKTHVQCSKDGCEFVASYKVVCAHHHIAHGKYAGKGFKTIDIEGQKFTVLLGTDPDEVNRWREARRKNYPTVAVVSKKEETHQRLVNAGVLSSKDTIWKKNQSVKEEDSEKRVCLMKNKRPPNLSEAECVAKAMKKRRKGEDNHNAHVKTSQADPELRPSDHSTEVSSIDKVAEASSMKNEEAIDSIHLIQEEEMEEDENLKEVESLLFEPGPSVCRHFLNGKCYAGKKCKLVHVPKSQPCRHFVGGKCFKGKKCNYTHSEEARKDFQVSANVETSIKQNSLLKKLLAKDIHIETQILLQAIKYIVENNFLN